MVIPSGTSPGYTAPLNFVIYDDDIMEGTEEFLVRADIIFPQPGMATFGGTSQYGSVTVIILDDDNNKENTGKSTVNAAYGLKMDSPSCFLTASYK